MRMPVVEKGRARFERGEAPLDEAREIPPQNRPQGSRAVTHRSLKGVHVPLEKARDHGLLIAQDLGRFRFRRFPAMPCLRLHPNSLLGEPGKDTQVPASLQVPSHESAEF